MTVDQTADSAAEQIDTPLRARELIARVAWVCLQIMLAYYVGKPVAFFYQGF